MKTVKGLALAVLFTGLVAWSPAFSALPLSPGVVDLQILAGDITFDPDSGTARTNDVVNISLLMHNLGDEPAMNVSVAVSFNTTDTALQSIGTFNLGDMDRRIEPGASYSHLLKWNTLQFALAAGVNYTVHVWLFNDTILPNQTDLDLANNRASVNITFLPDVIPVVSDLTTSTDTPIVGETVRVSAVLQNTGTRPAISEPVNFHLDGHLIQTNVTDIPPDQVTYVSFDWDTTGLVDGSHSLSASVRSSTRSTLLSFKYLTNPHITRIESSKYEASAGEKIFINATLDNNGTQEALDVVVDLYLDLSGTPLGNRTALVVPVNTPTPVSYLWDTTDVPVGNHTVKARVRGTVREGRTANITIGEALYPDLTITELNISKTGIIVGETVRIMVNVTNIGDRAPDQNTTLQLLLDSTEQIEEVNITPLQPGEFTVLSVDWDTSSVIPGVHSVVAQVDLNGEIEEKDDGNNDARLSLMINGTIDLTVTDLTFSLSLNRSNSTGEIIAGQTVWAWVTVKNLGSLMSGPNINLSLYLDEAPQPFLTYMQTSSVRNFTANLKWETAGLFNDTAVRTHTVRAVVDPDDRVEESNETNNHLSVELLVRPFVPPPDLAVLSVNISKAEARTGETITISTQVVNKGGEAAFNITLRFEYTWNGTSGLIKNQVVEYLQPGESRNLTQPWTVLVLEGTCNVWVTIDPQNMVPEGPATRGDNRLNSTLVILPAEDKVPDLKVVKITLKPREPRRGEKVTVGITLANPGNAAATGLNLLLLVDGKVDRSLTVPDLLAGEIRNMSLEWTAREGAKSINVRVEGANLPQPVTGLSVGVSVSAEASPASNLPIIILLVILFAGAILLVARGATERLPKEEGEEE